MFAAAATAARRVETKDFSSDGGIYFRPLHGPRGVETGCLDYNQHWTPFASGVVSVDTSDPG